MTTEKPGLSKQTLPSKSSEWYVGFGTCEDVLWWQKPFVEPEWQHCFCFAQVGPIVQTINPTRQRIEVGIQTTPEGEALSAYDHAKTMHGLGYTVIRVNHVPETLNWRSIFPPSCVSVVKAFLGYNTGFFTFTPKKLCFHLLKSGKGELLFV